MPNKPCRLIHNIGTRVSLRRFWGEDCPQEGGRMSYHNTNKLISDVLLNEKRDIDNAPEKYDETLWPQHCDHCGAAVPADAERQVFTRLLYDTNSGSPEPGDMYFAPWYHPDGYCRWDNCKDPQGHLIVVLPNGHTWDLNSRASNCTMKEDKMHRCWVLHGEAPHITADKNGYTCGAGAGSILVGDYHGFLIDGELREC
jgi:hypothetical protein